MTMSADAALLSIRSGFPLSTVMLSDDVKPCDAKLGDQQRCPGLYHTSMGWCRSRHTGYYVCTTVPVAHSAA